MSGVASVGRALRQQQQQQQGGDDGGRQTYQEPQQPEQQEQQEQQAVQRLHEHGTAAGEMSTTDAGDGAADLSGAAEDADEGSEADEDGGPGGSGDGGGDGGDSGDGSGGGSGDGGGVEAAASEAAASEPLRPPSPPRRSRSPPSMPSPPPLELVAMPDPKIAVPERCVFILGTGRSGSTSLTDALNQLPNYLIRGEQEGAFWHLYLAWRTLHDASEHSKEFRVHQRQAEQLFGERGASRLSYDTVKRAYDTYAVQKKLPWFNDLHRARLTDAARLFYAEAYGYHGPGIVSGFKEIRFVCGRAFPSPGCRYTDFDNFIRFLRLLCTDVKVLLNSRASHLSSDNHKLNVMLSRNGLINDTSRFEKDLAVTHEWYDRYAGDHTGVAFRVIMEDMFDPKKNASLAQRLLKFLGEDPAVRIAFNRMPTWSDPTTGGGGGSRSSRSKTAKPHHRNPWDIRRRRRGLSDVTEAERREAEERQRRLEGAAAAAAAAASVLVRAAEEVVVGAAEAAGGGDDGVGDGSGVAA